MNALWTILPILAATAAAMVWGAVWYGALGPVWMRAAGVSEETVATGGGSAYGVAATAAVVSAFGMAWLFGVARVAGPLDGLLTAGAIGLFFAVPWTLTHYAFADRPKALWWIDGVHTVGALAIIGLVLGLFH